MTPKETFGNLLRGFRVRAALTQERLAAAIDVDYTYISKIERDKAPPPARDKIAVAAVVLKLTASERDELFAAAQKLPAELESWVVSKPGALQLYRRLSAYPTKRQARVLEELLDRIDEIDKESGPGSRGRQKREEET